MKCPKCDDRLLLVRACDGISGVYFLIPNIDRDAMQDHINRWFREWVPDWVFTDFWLDVWRPYKGGEWNADTHYRCNGRIVSFFAKSLYIRLVPVLLVEQAGCDHDKTNRKR